MIPYFRPGDKALAHEITRYTSGHAAILLANHGPVVSGKDLILRNVVEELEETAKLMLLLGARQVRTLTESQIQELREVFKAEW